MVMKDTALTKVIFCARARMYFRNVVNGEDNVYNSTVFNLLNTCSIFGLIDEVKVW